MSSVLRTTWLCVQREANSMASRWLLIVGSVILLGVGTGLLYTVPDPSGLPYLLLHLVLFGGTLLGVLLGLFSAQDEPAEHRMLFSRLHSIFALIFGKFMVRSAVVTGVLFLLMIPSMVVVSEPLLIVLLVVGGGLLSAVFVALGLTAGYLSSRPVYALGLGLVFWIVVLYGVDLLAIVSSSSSWVQSYPWIWVGALFFSPVDVVRLAVLNHLENLFAEGALTEGWLMEMFDYIEVAALGSTVFWTALLLSMAWFLCCRREW